MSELETVTQILLDSMELVTDTELIRDVAKSLGWPSKPASYLSLWVVDGESPRTLAEKVLAALTSVAEVARLRKEIARLRKVEEAARAYVASDPPRPEWKALCDALGADWRQV
jgi:hypothetical protein